MNFLILITLSTALAKTILAQEVNENLFLSQRPSKSDNISPESGIIRLGVTKRDATNPPTTPEIATQETTQSTGVTQTQTQIDSVTAEILTCCTDGWLAYKGSCYKFASEQYDYNNAVDYCHRRNATLVVLDSKEEIDTVMAQAPLNTFTWLGLSDQFAMPGVRSWQSTGGLADELLCYMPYQFGCEKNNTAKLVQEIVEEEKKKPIHSNRQQQAFVIDIGESINQFPRGLSTQIHRSRNYENGNFEANFQRAPLRPTEIHIRNKGTRNLFQQRPTANPDARDVRNGESITKEYEYYEYETIDDTHARHTTERPKISHSDIFRGFATTRTNRKTHEDVKITPERIKHPVTFEPEYLQSTTINYEDLKNSDLYDYEESVSSFGTLAITHKGEKDPVMERLRLQMLKRALHLRILGQSDGEATMEGITEHEMSLRDRIRAALLASKLSGNGNRSVRQIAPVLCKNV